MNLKNVLISAISMCSILAGSAEGCFAAKYFDRINEYVVDIDFGEKMTKQEKEGYEPHNARTVWERYQQSRAAIPESVPVLENFDIKGETQIFVSPDGDDSNSGTIDAPVKSIQKAIDLILRLKNSQKMKGVVIYLRGGSYVLDKPIEINAMHCDLIENSGLIISAYNNEDVVIGGLNRFNASVAQKVTEENTPEEIYSRVHEDAKGKLYYIDYATLGIVNMPGFRDCVPSGTVKLSCKQGLFEINDNEVNISRYPDAGNDGIEKVLVGGEFGQTPATFTPRDKKVFTWKQNGTIGIYGQFCTPWSIHGGFYDSADVEAQTITEMNSLQLKGYPVQHILIYEGGGYANWYYYNVLEETNLENEWCFDDEDKRVYFIPSGGELKETDILGLHTTDLKSVFKLTEAKNVIFNGISFKDAEDGVNLSLCENVVIQNCKFTDLTDNGVLCVKGIKCGVINSVFEDVYKGIWFNTENPKTYSEFRASRNFVQNNYFANCSQGVHGTGIGGIISHNYFTNIEGEAIYQTHTECIVEYNEIVVSNLKGYEGALFYNGGTIHNSQMVHLRRNYFHDTRGPLSKAEKPGMVAFDDMCDGFLAYENVFDDRKSGAIGSHGGDDCVYDGNYFYHCNGGAGNSTHYYLSDRYKNYALNNPKASAWSINAYEAFTNYEKWREHFPYVYDKLNFVIDLSDKYWADNNTFTSEGNEWLGADTGSYYVNNKYIGMQNAARLSSPTKNGLQYTHMNEDVLNHPEKINKKFGMDYNVVENEQIIEEMDLSEIEFMKDIGITSKENNFYNEILEKQYSHDSITVTYPKSPTEIIEAEDFGVAWLAIPESEFYRITIAFDPDFRNIIHLEDVNKTNFTTKDLLPTKMKYYYKVEAYGLGRSKGNYMKKLCESPVYEVEYRNTYIPPNDGTIQYATPVLDGIMDDCYKSSVSDIIDTQYNSATGMKKPHNKVNAHYVWDDDYVYAYVEVSDSEIVSLGTEAIMSSSNPWENDVLELYIHGKKLSIDPFNIRLFSDKFTDEQIKMLPRPVVKLTKNGAVVSDTSDIDQAHVERGTVYKGADGFIVEMALPLKQEYGDVYNGNMISVRLQNNDAYDMENKKTAYKQNPTRQYILDGSNFDGNMSFTDVNYTDWYYNSVKDLYIKRVIDGVSETEFAPNETMSRAMFLTVLGRLSEDNINTSSDSWYMPYIEWAKEHNIVDISEEYAQGDITREEMAIYIYNYALYKDKKLVQNIVDDFVDIDKYSAETRVVLKRLKAAGIINGIDDAGNYYGEGNATRAEACTIISKYEAAENLTGGTMDDIA